jgi:hypothetical protein
MLVEPGSQAGVHTHAGWVNNSGAQCGMELSDGALAVSLWSDRGSNGCRQTFDETGLGSPVPTRTQFG